MGRWAVVLVAFILTLAIGGPHLARDLIAAAAVIAFSALRTVAPPDPAADWAVLFANVVIETGVALAVVLVTGTWQSHFFFLLVVPIALAGFGRGFGWSSPAALVLLGAVGVAAAAQHQPHLAQVSTVGSAELAMVALVTGYARYLFGEAEQRTKQMLSRLGQLSEANALLLALNRVTQQLPASLDLSEVMASTAEQLRMLLRPDVLAILLWDVAIGRWTVGVAEGVRLPDLISEGHLPEPIRERVLSDLHMPRPALVDLATSGPGLGMSTTTALYVPLVARRILVGLIAVESRPGSELTAPELSLVTGLAEQAALAIDNAQWFGRLRTLGAEEERTRIARELHDRVAQSLAYLAFELDRITRLSAEGVVTQDLDRLRTDVRQVVTEVRDALYDLRTTVSESQDLATTLDAFTSRVAARSGLDVRCENRVSQRPPLPVEREFWRIAQEAVTNSEHHAAARHVVVVWEASPTEATLRVVDDGRGFPIGASGRLDSYGLRGMRERADAIGATLVIDSHPGSGTTVECHLSMA